MRQAAARAAVLDSPRGLGEFVEPVATQLILSQRWIVAVPLRLGVSVRTGQRIGRIALMNPD